MERGRRRGRKPTLLFPYWARGVGRTGSGCRGVGRGGRGVDGGWGQDVEEAGVALPVAVGRVVDPGILILQ